MVVTVLEGEENDPRSGGQFSENGPADCWGVMSVLSGCITVASAAMIDAGIDCVDIVTGGMAAMIRQPTAPPQIILDPCPSDHKEISAACVIGYLQTRDEITGLWTKGNMTTPESSDGVNTAEFESLLDQAVEAATTVRLVLIEAIKESTEVKIQTAQSGQSKNVAG